jgi:hypothetical protein
VTPRRSWIEDSTDVVVDELGRFDLVASRTHVSELIRGRVTAVATGLNIKEQSARRYLHEEALRDLAREVAVKLADEQPGANLHQLPRTIPMSPQGFGICIAALAEVGHFRELNADAVGVHGALQLISLFAQVLYEHPEASDESFLRADDPRRRSRVSGPRERRWTRSRRRIFQRRKHASFAPWRERQVRAEPAAKGVPGQCITRDTLPR